MLCFAQINLGKNFSCTRRENITQTSKNVIKISFEIVSHSFCDVGRFVVFKSFSSIFCFVLFVFVFCCSHFAWNKKYLNFPTFCRGTVKNETKKDGINQPKFMYMHHCSSCDRETSALEHTMWIEAFQGEFFASVAHKDVMAWLTLISPRTIQPSRWLGREESPMSWKSVAIFRISHEWWITNKRNL